ncbi:MAG TPA: phospholipase D-like domain-containing protein [Gemmatimonadaceae bacterium]|nr:phospholipase D-like domain-containing protein [Gemmatimonadaceae bacterium]
MHQIWRYGKKTALALLVLVVLVFALIGVLDVTRGTPVHSVLTVGRGASPAVRESLFVRTMQVYTGTALERGNRVDVLLNGDGTYPRFWRDLRGARESITAQFYYSLRGAVADTFANILIERHRAGVDVLLLLDAFGSQPLKGAWVDRLRGAGVTVAFLRPLHWYTLHKADHRSHVRAIVIDGRIGYTGGFGLADYWQGDGLHEGQWRETNVRFEGPAVAQLQATFASGWAEATGRLLVGEEFFPRAAVDSSASGLAGLMHTVPTVGSTSAERFLALTIAGARRTLYITNSYFVPDDDFRHLLVAAARRGVDVRILGPGPRTDVKTTLYAARESYDELLTGGVRVYEYQPTNLHAKTIVADAMWSSIGSMNFDNRSLAFNDEAALVVLDSVLGARMDSIFLADLTHAREVTRGALEARSPVDRLLQWGASLLSRVL